MATLARVDEAVILACEPRFRLGILDVIPALRQIAWAGQTRTLEPRVMQVLVALAQAGGEIIGRDDLTARCWDGRIVGDSSINRVISLLRGLAAESGAFEIETITKVGYRLTVRGLSAVRPLAICPQPAPRPLFTRRRALAGAGAVLATGAAYLSWSGTLVPGRREARRLYEAGVETQRRGGEASARQAIVYFRKAVTADPDFADAWAALAYSQYQLINASQESVAEALAASARDAAEKALRLDPNNGRALLTLALLAPNFRNWDDIERQAFAALKQMPNEVLLHSRLAAIYADTGRWGDALTRAKWIIEREPMVPEHQLRLAGSLWHSGQVAAARPIFSRALELWPVEPFVWLANFLFLSFTGDTRAALAMAEGNAFGLDGASPLPRTIGLAGASALESRNPAEIKALVATIGEARSKGTIASFIAIPYLAALGAIDPAYAVAYDYYLGRRDAVSGERQPISPMAPRQTAFLFTSATAPLRSDPRFARLTAAIGLGRYWARSGSRPDYLRA